MVAICVVESYIECIYILKIAKYIIREQYNLVKSIIVVATKTLGFLAWSPCKPVGFELDLPDLYC